MHTLYNYVPAHRYETVAWIPSVIAFVVMLGAGGKHLGSHIPPGGPAPAASILSFATTVASSVISWCRMTPDYGVYHTAQASRSVSRLLRSNHANTCFASTRVFLYSYAGFLMASVSRHPNRLFGCLLNAVIHSSSRIC